MQRLILFVGVRRFERPTSRPPDVHSNQLSYTPLKFKSESLQGICASGCENKPFLGRENG